MKERFNLQQAGMMSVFLFGFWINLYPQGQPENKVVAGGDLVSNYIWRGTKLGTGPAIQPFLEISMGNFTLGTWGSYCFTTDEAAEADLYANYTFNFGLSLGITDYYFPGTQYFDFSQSTGAHGYEINLAYSSAHLNLSANYIINEAGGAGTAGGDKYFEAGYTFSNISLFIGAGDGWHTSDGNFAFCNAGLSARKNIELTEKLSLPLTVSAIWNPEKEQFYVVFGISLKIR